MIRRACSTTPACARTTTSHSRFLRLTRWSPTRFGEPFGRSSLADSSYQEAQRTRVTIAAHAGERLKERLDRSRAQTGWEAGCTIRIVSVNDGGGRFTFDYPAFAATADVTLDMVGRAKTISRLIDKAALTRFRWHPRSPKGLRYIVRYLFLHWLRWVFAEVFPRERTRRDDAQPSARAASTPAFTNASPRR